MGSGRSSTQRKCIVHSTPKPENPLAAKRSFHQHSFAGFVFAQFDEWCDFLPTTFSGPVIMLIVNVRPGTMMDAKPQGQS